VLELSRLRLHKWKFRCDNDAMSATASWTVFDIEAGVQAFRLVTVGQAS
jgi:hypothetical protein